MPDNINYIIPPLVSVTDQLIPRYFTGAPELSDTAKYKSYLGTPVFGPFEFLKTDGLNVVANEPSTSDVILRIDTMLQTVHQPKEIVKTKIQGRDGTIKEYVGLSDHIITLEGVIIAPQVNRFPQEDFDILMKIVKHPGQLRVTSEWLLLFGITFVVVDDYEISQKSGSRNEVPFRMMLTEDRDEKDDLFIKQG